MPEILSEFVAEPAQWAFLNSTATVRGYGGAMGGGKSRTLMEACLDFCIDWPGIQILVCRQRHTSIIETTRRTFAVEVLGSVAPALLAGKKQSMGEDWMDIRSSMPGVLSRVNFIGLDDPVKWFSSEIGALIFDEGHELAESDVSLLMTRLRQRGMPHKTLIGFNPGNPGHWLERWFIRGAAQTEHGFYQRELVPRDAEQPLGDAEFIFANAYQNPHLPAGYIERALESLPRDMRRRLLDGEWVLTDGSLFFDAESLTVYDKLVNRPWRVGVTAGDLSGENQKDKIRIVPRRDGSWSVWKPPVRGERPHRYIVAVDVSSGGGADYTGIQVLDVEAFEQVAEFQGKLDPDLAALEAFRIAAIFNGALVVPEVTGGWGFTIVRAVERLLPRYKGVSKPRLYTRPVLHRLTKQWTDQFGFDTNLKTRMVMLDGLEEVIRERELKLNGARTVSELKAFARDERGRPAAIAGEHDDLVIPLAIAVYVAMSQPRQLRRVRRQEHQALVSATGY